MKRYIEILDVFAREVIDSRGNPTVEAEVICEGGILSRAIVPSGASTGEYEACELRDNDEKRYMGKGVLKAVENVNNIISEKIIGMNVLDQLGIDNALIELDGTKNKSKLGANAILAVSIACARAGAKALGIDLYNYVGGIFQNNLPVPMMNILNGGAHSNNNIDIQEFMIMPVGAPSFKEALRWCAQVYHTLKKMLNEKGLSTSVGDEGGFSPNLPSDEDALGLIVDAIKKAGFNTKTDFKLALDAASSEWVSENGCYHMPKSDNVFTTDELINYYENLIEKYPIISIEDALGENDWDGWEKITKKLGSKIMLVGDDLFVTNKEKVELGVKRGVANAVLVKVNQIGTLSETKEAINVAKKAGYNIILSHRSGETEDTTISDLSVGFASKFIKCGAPTRSERCAKYNRLLRIEEELSDESTYNEI